MIVVSVDLASAIHPSRSRRLAMLHIVNDGGGTATHGSYDVIAYGAGGHSGKKGRVEHYPRKAVAVLNLVHRAIEAAGYTK